MIPTPIGKRRWKITIEEASTAPDATGELVETWSTLFTRWASMEPLSAREAWQAKQAQARASLRFRMPYAAGVTCEMRLNHRGTIYGIEQVINVEMANRELEILAIEA